MAITKFVPELWIAAVQVPFFKNLVYAQAGVSNRTYEGQIRQMGDTVRVTTISDPTVRPYVKASDITVEDVTDGEVVMSIDQGSYFAFRVNDVDRVQAAGDFQNPALQQASYGLRDDQDQYVASVMAAGAHADNKMGAVTVDAASELYDLLVDLSVLLDEASVPSEGRWAVLSPAMHGLLRKDSRFIATGDMPAAQARLNGQVGEAAGFSLLKSNNTPDVEESSSSVVTDVGDVLIAGHPSATSVADQLLEVEALRSEARFADLVRGLNVYGSKVFRPTALATADVTIDLSSS